MRKEVTVWLNFELGKAMPDFFWHKEQAINDGAGKEARWKSWGYKYDRMKHIAMPATLIYDETEVIDATTPREIKESNQSEHR